MVTIIKSVALVLTMVKLFLEITQVSYGMISLKHKEQFKKAIDKEMDKDYPMEKIEVAIKKTTNKSIRNMIICMALMLILCII